MGVARDRPARQIVANGRHSSWPLDTFVVNIIVRWYLLDQVVLVQVVARFRCRAVVSVEPELQRQPASLQANNGKQTEFKFTRDTPQKMSNLRKFYVSFVPERHFCGVSLGFPPFYMTKAERQHAMMNHHNDRIVPHSEFKFTGGLGTLRKNVALVQNSRKTSVDWTFFAECPWASRHFT